MLSLEQVKNFMSDRNLKEVSRRTGIAYLSLLRIYNGSGQPSYKTLELLSNYFMDKK